MIITWKKCVMQFLLHAYCQDSYLGKQAMTKPNEAIPNTANNSPRNGAFDNRPYPTVGPHLLAVHRFNFGICEIHTTWYQQKSLEPASNKSRFQEIRTGPFDRPPNPLKRPPPTLPPSTYLSQGGGGLMGHLFKQKRWVWESFIKRNIWV